MSSTVKVDSEVAIKKERTQLTNVLDISVSQARVASHLKLGLGDQVIEKEISDLRSSIKNADEGSAKLIKTNIATLAKKIVRVSGETPIAVATLWDAALKELIVHGIKLAHEEGGMVGVGSLHGNGVQNLLYLPLYSKCPSWTSYEQKSMNIKLAEAAEAKELKPKKSKKKQDDGGAVLETTQKKKKSVPKEEFNVDVDENGAPSFNTYVDNALKIVKNKDGIKTRFSTFARSHLSSLIAEGIARQASLTKILVQDSINVRTVNSNHVKLITHVMLSDGGRTPDECNAVLSHIDHKLSTYRTHVAGEKNRKNPKPVASEQKQEVPVIAPTVSPVPAVQKNIPVPGRRVKVQRK